MALLAPLWLLALLPWAAFSIWLWIGRRRRRWVPFLPLWDAPQELRRPKRGVEPPPIGLLLAILALLAGLVAMSRPVLISADRGPVTVIVDRGATMSAQAAGQPRFAKAAQTAAPELKSHLGPGPIELIDLIDASAQSTDRSDWASLVARWKRSALDTALLLQTTVRHRLAAGQTVLLLSDQDPGLVDPKLVVIPPAAPVHNASIIALAAQPGQVMVTLRATDATSRALHLQAGDRTADTRVNLAANTDQNVFVNLDTTAADTIQATLDGADDFDADDRAYLVRQRDWAKIEPRVPLPDALRRMIAVYSHHRPPGAASTPLPIARPGELKSDEPGVLLAPLASTESTPVTAAISTAPHPLTTGVDFSPVAKSAALAQRNPGEGWQRLAWIGDKTILAIRTGDSARQVWIGFDSRDFERTPDFVVFWTNVFDSLAGASQGFAASPIGTQFGADKRILPASLSQDIDPRYWPGVFETAAGKTAANATAPHFAASRDRAWVDQLARLAQQGPGIRPLSPALALAALVLLLGAAWRWEKRRRPSPNSHTAHLVVEQIDRVQPMVPADGLVHPHHATVPPKPEFLDRSG